MNPELKIFDSGAVRSKDADATRYDLISPIGMRRLAETCAVGAERYGAHNYEQGMPVSEMLNHALRHIYLHLQGDRSEDHLAHGAWNMMAACHSEELWPHLNVDLRRGACVPPNVHDLTAATWGKPNA